jgi:hypothetical protein
MHRTLCPSAVVSPQSFDHAMCEGHRKSIPVRPNSKGGAKNVVQSPHEWVLRACGPKDYFFLGLRKTPPLEKSTSEPG